VNVPKKANNAKATGLYRDQDRISADGRASGGTNGRFGKTGGLSITLGLADIQRQKDCIR